MAERQLASEVLMEGAIVGDGGNGAKWTLVGYVRGGAQKTRSGQTSPGPACAARGPIPRLSLLALREADLRCFILLLKYATA